MRGSWVRTMLWCGAVAGPLFLLAATALGAFRAHYDAIRLAISGLGVGRYGWTQGANFVICGMLILALAVGLHLALHGRGERWGPILVGLIGVGLIGAGLFATDPGGGFPPADQAQPGPTLHGHLHDLFSVFVFAGFPAAAFVLAAHFAAHRDRGWAVWTRLCGVVLAVGFAVVLIAFNRRGFLSDIAGVIQRGWLTIAFGWLTAVTIHVLRALTAPSQPAAIRG